MARRSSGFSYACYKQAWFPGRDRVVDGGGHCHEELLERIGLERAVSEENVVLVGVRDPWVADVEMPGWIAELEARGCLVGSARRPRGEKW